MSSEPDIKPRFASFSAALEADGPAADRADRMGLYAWLIGDWVMDASVYRDDGSCHVGQGEIHFAWALDGRAIQDVWITPPRPERPPEPGAPLPTNFYGTTLRVYDPGLDAWHVFWLDPTKQFYARMVGRAEGVDIVQDGEDASGTPIRWRFTAITPDSFHWLGLRSPDRGKSWRLQIEFFAHRVP